MSAQYSHEFRDTQVNVDEYNEDHQRHIDNRCPQTLGGYSQNISEMRQESDPGESGSENLPNSLAGELERLRFAISELKASTIWYDAGTIDFVAGTRLCFIQPAAPANWTYVAAWTNRLVMTATAASTAAFKVGGTWTLSGLSARHDHVIFFTDTTGTSLGNSSVTAGSGNAAPPAHTHTIFFSATTSVSAGTVSSNGAWRPAYVDSIVCVRDS